MNSNTSTLEGALAHLLQKYSVETAFQRYSLTLSSERDICSLVSGWQLLGDMVSETRIPLMPWRSKKRFIELHNLVQQNIVQNPSLLRFCFFTDDSWTLEAQLYREFDIVEFVMGSKVVALHTVLNGDRGGNVIATLANGVLCSIELSNQLPKQSSLVDRHEIICERGVASDLVVDTQIPQNSVYLFTEKGRSEFTDYDAELYGFGTDEIDLVRAAYAVISGQVAAEECITQHDHLEALVHCALKSGVENRKINISETLIYEIS